MPRRTLVFTREHDGSAENVERLMWSTARALEEQGEYMSQVADQLADGEDSTMARNYLRKALSAMQKADALQKLITRR